MRARLASLLLILAAPLGCADPVSDGAMDADADAGSIDRGAPPPDCVDDRFGFGTADLPAVTLGLAEQADLVVCPPNPDWIAIDAPAGAAVAAVVRADRPVVATLGARQSAPGRVVVVRGAVPPSGAVLAVRAADDAAPVPYQVTIAPAVDECGDGQEPDDRPAEATLLVGAIDGVVCVGDVDLYRVEGSPGALVRVTATLTDGQGIGLASVAAFEAAAAIVEQADDGEAPVLERRLPSDGSALFAVRPRGAGGAYRVRATVEAADPIELRDEAGVVLAPDRALDGEGLGAAEHAAAADVLVDALVDGVLIDVVRTDAAGRWTLSIPADPAAHVEVRVRASVWRAGKRFEVGPVLDRPWAAPASDAPIDAAGALGPALHVALTAAEGVARLAPHLSVLRQPPALRVVWTPGGASGCGTCYRPASDHVELSGRLTDPDEWDDGIILHEVAHHLAVHHGRDDSPGGAHDGSPVAPALAWSEGFASAVAAWLLGDPLLLDARATGVRTVDLEAMDDPRAVGTADGTAVGALSEYLVAAVLWDALDAGAEDPVTLGPEVVFGAGFSGLALRAVDAGAPGMDLLDHADEMACRAEPSIGGLLAARGVPATPTCRNKPASLIQTRDGLWFAGCDGVARRGAARWSVARGVPLPMGAPLQLTCGAVREYADPPRPERPAQWRARAGAAQLD